MEEKYQRGDLLEQNQPKYDPDKIKSKGEAMEVMITTDGWKYLKEWMEDRVEKNTKMLIDIRQDDIGKINDMRVLLAVFKGMIGRPQEWIDEKNKVIKKEAK